jgi:hypothetical protein
LSGRLFLLPKSKLYYKLGHEDGVEEAQQQELARQYSLNGTNYLHFSDQGFDVKARTGEVENPLYLNNFPM